MAEPKWTPGPWTVMKDSRIIGFQFTSPRVWTKAEDRVADVEICILNPWEEWEDQRLADAHLIAAAPDLYEACEEALRVLEVRDTKLAAERMAVRMLTRALSKARGEEVTAE